MKRSLLTLSFCLLFWHALVSAALAAESDLVLVASSESAVAQLSTAEVRKLYLGMPAFADGRVVTPMRNHSDSFLQEVFMQKVMFMSTPAYDRQILSRVFRVGGNRPPIFTNLHKLLDALRADPSAVTYMYRDEASAHPDLKILSTLWEAQD